MIGICKTQRFGFGEISSSREVIVTANVSMQEWKEPRRGMERDAGTAYGHTRAHSIGHEKSRL